MTTRQVKLIGKKKFAAAALNPKHEVIIVHIAALSINLGDEVHPSRRAQIAHLKADKAFIKIFSKHTNFTDVFFPKLAIKLFEYTKIKDYAIKLVDS